ncbi:DUF2017 family protein [Mobiluncus curtisii]|uniref:Uncharacterized protein n=2 Tax=Mobiluncus curtisii TaxID=2051 RepID=D6ZI62_MOBCV|nr:DUF2017 family protein [Mobiluncus curtisii]ADI66411.1 hypothetical protein HMPREF0573_10092 [Mobiluncus curtisii ATCC 43063]EFL92907.1 hypothetical protein HMPREF0574_1508 [Mobiluncus curtisii subsp. curtisii ATCC 35241]MCU9987079.1 DUF2017 family protein [Mobiluncus curtisii]MCU9999979.1 DUF2017 family protein [Mobiluncus curtisii]MCV0020373.1 DUF2017 family protein [Mobiluncus curtisii]
MRAFAALNAPSEGWFSRVEPHEAVLLAGIFEELADAMEAEEQRDVLDMMGVDLDPNSPKEHTLMFEKLLGVDTVSSITSRPELHSASEETETETDLNQPHEQPGESATPRRGNTGFEPNSRGMTDDQTLAALDFDPLGPRPCPANPYIAAILRPMSQDPEEAAELRALTTPDLAAKKTAAMRTVAESLRWAAHSNGAVMVKPEALKVWVTAINDARLALGWSLGIDNDTRAEEVELMAESDPETGVYTAYEITIASIYNALSWWLETLMYAVDG